MTDIAITAEGLGKQYRIGALVQRPDTLRDQIAQIASRPAARLRARVRAVRRADGTRGGPEFIWALRDVSFEVAAGEVVGIIGRNGAGKSTLLKVLSRITEPTEGRALVRGRVGSLLEVGTGFHPELTGRENIYLSGAIMGMRRGEIRKRFDEMVEFAGVAQFIDTPIKRYSSGMFVRLAFGVAAFLEPEILLVDEVLSVGDAEFQRRCLGKMGNVAKEGRTVLLVSHNMGAISQLCPRSIWIDHGGVRLVGDTASTVAAYLDESDAGGPDAHAEFDEDATKDAQLRSARIIGSDGKPRQRFSCDEPVVLELVYQVHTQLRGVYALLQVSGADGTPVLVSYSFDSVPNPLDNLPVGLHLVRLVVPARTLAAGSYRLQFSIGHGRQATRVVDDCGTICSFALEDLTSLKGNGRLGYFSTLLPWDVGAVERTGARVD